MRSALLRIFPVLVALFIVCVPLVADYSYASAPALQVNVVHAAEGDPASKEISPAVCDGVISCLVSLPKLIWFYGMSAIGAALVYVATIILSLAALLFDWLITHTVIQFGALYGTIKVAVETAWTAFRDIANILIIGMFTFFAISIILGLKEYNQKRLVAKVLIVAVLINFSLLGTKMVIDASNYVAGQIYNAAQLGGTSASGTATGATKYGIADQFMYLLGVQTAAKTWKTVSDTALAKDSGWAALGHGILLTFVLLGAAVVLFYGSFLLISRMIMLIFLLITSAIAVGSSLVPGWEGSSYGWDAWKSSLIWCTMFAPIIMILLWVTLNVSYAMKGTYKATLGAALSDPAGGSNTEAIFMYLLVLGMLYATFSISSKWSSKIGGFSYATGGVATALGLTSRLAGYGLQKSVGFGAAKIEKGLGSDLSRARRLGAQMRAENRRVPGSYSADRLAQVDAIAKKTEGRKNIAGWFTKQNYNLAQSKLVDIAAKEAGASSWISSGDKKASFEADAKKKADAAAARAEAGFNLTRGDQDKIKEREQRRLIREQKVTAETQRDSAEKAVLAAEQQATNDKTRLQQEKVAAEQRGTAEKARLKSEKQAREQQVAPIMQGANAQKDIIKSEIQQLQKDLNKAAPGSAQETKLKNEIATKHGAMQAEDAKISKVHEEIKSFEQQIQAVEENTARDRKSYDEQMQALDINVVKSQEVLKTAAEKLKEFDDANSKTMNEIAKTAQKTVDTAVDESKKVAADAAERYGKNPLARLYEVKTYGGDKARSTYEEKQAKSAARKTLEDIIGENIKSSTPPPAKP